MGEVRAYFYWFRRMRPCRVVAIKANGVKNYLLGYFLRIARSVPVSSKPYWVRFLEELGWCKVVVG